MKKQEFDLLLYINDNEVVDLEEAARKLYLDEETLENICNSLKEDGYIEDFNITEKGKICLEEHKIDNAIILAAGMSTRFVPLNFEKPKGLLEVNGETLIERQINQLREKGIKEIIVVVGHMKEHFE